MRKSQPTEQVRYPWAKWFRRKTTVLTRGWDYHCMTYSMMAQIRNYASARGYRVSVKAIELQDTDVIEFTVTQRPGRTK